MEQANKYMKKQKGFTIIELIVVIAIIAVLAGVVLVNVTQYITKGRDAAAKGNLATMLTNGVVYYDTKGNYNNFCKAAATSKAFAAGTLYASTDGDSMLIGPVNALTTSTPATGYAVTFYCSDGSAAASCDGTGNAIKNWCAYITLKVGTNTYCVDSNGGKVTKSSGGSCVLATGTCAP
jgi:prepilin-type N-terminal cleavage/methylation domain-containing protein